MKASVLTRTVLQCCAAFVLVGTHPSQGQATESSSPSIRSVIRIIPGASSQDVFRRPSGLFVDAGRGLFLVADGGNHRLVVFEKSGRCRGSIALRSFSGGGEPCEPLGVAADSFGRLFVVEALGDRVSVLTSRGSRLGALEVPFPVESGSRPRAVEIGSSGLIYLLFGGPFAGVVVMDHGGRRMDGQGLALGAETLGSAISLAVNESAGLMSVVSPRAGKQVRLYGLDGRLRVEFGAHGEGDGTFSLAGHVTWGPANTIWVTDTLRHSISVFDARGEYVGKIGGFGRNPGQFCFPVACGFLSDDRLIVLERGTARCQILEVHMIPPDQLSLDSSDSVSLTAQTKGSNSTGGDSQ